MKTGIKKHTANEFYVKAFTHKGTTWYKVIDGYDKSMASLESTEEDAARVAIELNEMRNKRLKATGISVETGKTVIGKYEKIGGRDAIVCTDGFSASGFSWHYIKEGTLELA